MTWEDVLKMPPIENPLTGKEFFNDNLTMDEYDKLFSEVADPSIEKTGEQQNDMAVVFLRDLEMSEEKALEIAKELYKDKGYSDITSTKNAIIFHLK